MDYPDYQMHADALIYRRERDANDDIGARSTIFLCKNGEKEREHNAERSRGLRIRDSKSYRYEYDHTRSIVGSETFKAEG
eukprot:12635843-Heterocapsa_arctica.AAC.1